jgi:hypothetical protein
MDKQIAAARAVDAGTVAAQAVNDYGVTSLEALGALQTAGQVMQKAMEQGCTKDDFDAEHARRT